MAASVKSVLETFKDLEKQLKEEGFSVASIDVNLSNDSFPANQQDRNNDKVSIRMHVNLT